LSNGLITANRSSTISAFAHIKASKSAKVTVVAAIWGASDLEGIRIAAPDYTVATIEELRSLLRQL